MRELSIIFPDPKDLPSDHELWNRGKHRVPGKATLDAVNTTLLSADYTIDAKETEDTDLYEFITEEEKVALCDKHDSLDE